MIKTINGKEYYMIAGAELFDADLSGANLRFAELSHADLTGADLQGADLRDAELFGADLTGANLRDVELFGANLFGADLFGADLFGADLFGAELRDADLTGAKHIHSLYISQMSSRNDLVYAIEHESALMIKTGCFWGTFAEFKAKVISVKSADSLYIKVGIVALEALNNYLYQ
jgi:hypothetical protein